MSSSNSLSSDRSCLRTTRTNHIESPQDIRHFTLSFDEWQRFYDHKDAKVADNWTHQLGNYMIRAGVTCSIVFKYHGGRKKNSRKKNCNVFNCRGQCKIKSCQTEMSIIVEREPTKKEMPCIFTVYLFGDVNHSRELSTAGRPLQGTARIVMGMCFILNRTLEPMFVLF